MQLIRDTLKGLRVGEPLHFANLTLFPLLGGETGRPDYATLDEALASGQVRVSEIHEGGSVPQLAVVNEGDRAVFLLDGEELVGAKQNRVLNLTILVPAGKTTVIPVSCVEAGRWAWSSRAFSASPQVMYSKVRASKMAQVSFSMRSGDARRSNQGAVWEAIGAKAARMGTRSPSSAMSDIYEQSRQRVNDYVEHLRWIDGQAGAAFAINGCVEGLDLFGYCETMRGLLPKIVRSYALDAVEEPARDDFAAPTIVLERFLDDVAAARVEEFPAVGIGRDLRVSGPNLTGAGLALDDRIMHLGAFRLDRSDAVRGGGMASSSSRRRRSR